MAPITLQDEHGYNQLFALVGSTPQRMRRCSDWIVEQIAKAGASRVLEIGSGTGETAAYVAEHSDAEIIAVDISPYFVGEARARHSAPNLRFELFDLLGEAPLEFGQFDLVYGNGILHHLVKRLPAFLLALHRLTNPGGGIAFIEPNFMNPYCAFIFGTKIGRRFAKLEPDEMAFTSGELRRLLPPGGWQDVHVTTRDFLIPGIPAVFIKPILAMEPALEATILTRWLAQSHFITARA